MTDSQKLLSDIGAQDRKFRWARIIFAGLLIGIGAVTLIVALNILQKVEKQQQQLAEAVAELKQDNKTELKKANDHLDCIVLFFAQPDRLNKTLEGCNVIEMVAPQASTGASSKTVMVTPSQNSTSPSNFTQAKNQANKIINTLRRSFK